jgi:hypothetical protein
VQAHRGKHAALSITAYTHCSKLARANIATARVYSTRVHNDTAHTAHTAHALLPLCGAWGVRRGSNNALFIVRRFVNVRNFASRPTLWASRSRRWPSCEALKSCGIHGRAETDYALCAEMLRRCSAQELSMLATRTEQKYAHRHAQNCVLKSAVTLPPLHSNTSARQHTHLHSRYTRKP